MKKLITVEVEHTVTTIAYVKVEVDSSIIDSDGEIAKFDDWCEVEDLAQEKYYAGQFEEADKDEEFTMNLLINEGDEEE